MAKVTPRHHKYNFHWRIELETSQIWNDGVRAVIVVVMSQVWSALGSRSKSSENANDNRDNQAHQPIRLEGGCLNNYIHLLAFA